MYLNNVKSTNSNKKWVDIDIRGRSQHTLECKERLLQNSEYSVDMVDYLPIISRE